MAFLIGFLSSFFIEARKGAILILTALSWHLFVPSSELFLQGSCQKRDLCLINRI
jgi:hypothetical protein